MIITINLLQNQKDYKKLEDGFRLFRVGTVLFGFISLVCLIVIFSMNFYAQKSLKEATKQKKSLVDVIQKMEDKEAQILLIQEKMRSMNEIVSETPNYAAQFDTISSFMPVSSDSGKLQSIILDDNTAQSVLTFPNTTSLTTFLQTVDNPTFRQSFSDVELSSIKYADPQKKLELQLYVGFKKP